MGKSLKKLVVGLLLVGVVGLAVSKLTGGEPMTETESDGIDRVTTRDDGDEADTAEADTDKASDADADVDVDDEEDGTDLEVEVESDDEEFTADLDLPAASGGLDVFDYVAVLAAAARAGYKEYKNRV